MQVVFMIGKIKYKPVGKPFAFVRKARVGDEVLEDIFLTAAEFNGDWNALRAGDVIEFTPGVKSGRPQAFDAQLVSAGAR